MQFDKMENDDDAGEESQVFAMSDRLKWPRLRGPECLNRMPVLLHRDVFEKTVITKPKYLF
jgi:hypothetical protein